MTDGLPSKPLLTTGETARALSVSVQTIRNWVASGRIGAVIRGARTMIPREVVEAEIDRSRVHPRQPAMVSEASAPYEASVRRDQVARNPARPTDVYGWMERARAEGVHFPFDEYNARIPPDLLERAAGEAVSEPDLPAPWSEHFRPATEDEVLSLLSDPE